MHCGNLPRAGLINLSSWRRPLLIPSILHSVVLLSAFICPSFILSPSCPSWHLALHLVFYFSLGTCMSLSLFLCMHSHLSLSVFPFHPSPHTLFKEKKKKGRRIRRKGMNRRKKEKLKVRRQRSVWYRPDVFKRPGIITGMFNMFDKPYGQSGISNTRSGFQGSMPSYMYPHGTC